MAWNEPGNGKDKDPWGSRNKNEGPPDLDELLRKMQNRINGFFGGKKGFDKSQGGSGGSGSIGISFGLIFGIIVIIWLGSGIYIVDQAEHGVVLQFGAYNKTTDPGPHWRIPYPIQSVTKVNVDELRTASHNAQMLTKDENLIQIGMSIQFLISSAEDYLFKVRDPDYTLKEATESALREVVGSKTLDGVLSDLGGREVLVNETERNIQEILDLYQTGLSVIKVNLTSAQPPQEVQSAFEDAIKAKEDEDRYKKKAEAYERDIIPKAEGDVQRLIQEAEAYKQRVVEHAAGETSRFLQTLAEYRKAPQVTRKRMYLETMEEVFANTSKVLIKVQQGNNLMYLPLNQFMNRSSSAMMPIENENPLNINVPSDRPDISRRREVIRGREGR